MKDQSFIEFAKKVLHINKLTFQITWMIFVICTGCLLIMVTLIIVPFIISVDRPYIYISAHLVFRVEEFMIVLSILNILHKKKPDPQSRSGPVTMRELTVRTQTTNSGEDATSQEQTDNVIELQKQTVKNEEK